MRIAPALTRSRRAAIVVLLALAPGLLAPGSAAAQNFGLGLNTQDNGRPIDIQADDGIEWQQNTRLYIARGNARATRGQATIFADTLMAFYRPVCGPEARAAEKTKEAAHKDAPAGKDAAPAKACPDPPATPPPPDPKHSDAAANDPTGGNSTEIYRMEADGNVRIATETQTVYGDHAVYDVDRGLLVVTGQHLKLETQHDTVTARDTLEWYDGKQLAVARGDAVAVREGKRLRGDVLTSEVVKDQSGPSHISRIDAQGNVLVSSLDQIARGDTGVYNVDTGIATLTGRVTLTKGDSVLRGQYGVIDLNKNISHLLPGPPDAKTTAGQSAQVYGTLEPRPKPPPPPGEPAAKAPAK
jgi:lipopolysaccharide export system protein LptA